MQTKKYSSYAQIDNELAILKVEKEISYKKLVLAVEQTKESLSFLNISMNVLDTVKSTFFSSYSSVLRFLLPILINWFKNKRRG